MKIELLNPKVHNRTQFDCGVDALNTYLQCVANQDQKRNLTRVYVLAEKTDILGFYSISSHSVSVDELPDNLRLANYRSVPFLLLGRLAVDKRFKGQSHGAKLLYHALNWLKQSAFQAWWLMLKTSKPFLFMRNLVLNSCQPHRIA